MNKVWMDILSYLVIEHLPPWKGGHLLLVGRGVRNSESRFALKLPVFGSIYPSDRPSTEPENHDFHSREENQNNFKVPSSQ